MATGEITLRDLIAWTDLVTADKSQPSASGAARSSLLDRDVDWVVTARSTSPMLPNLRGGELVLLPERVANETSLDLHMLVQELANQPVAGVVLDTDQDVSSALPVLRTARITNELESELNRMLTTRRGDLLRTGTDIERIINRQRTEGAGPEELLTALAQRLGVDFVITTPSGNVLVSTTAHPPATAVRDATGGGWLSQPLRHNRRLLVGRLEPGTLALGRFVLESSADAVQRSLDEEATSVQDHSSRTRLINQAINAASIESQRASAMLRRAGIPPDSTFRIAVAPPSSPERDVWPMLRSIGTPVDAGIYASHQTWLVIEDGRQQQQRDHQINSWLAVSAPVTASPNLADGIRQVEFLIAVKTRELLGTSMIRFDDTARLGALRLLFDQWGCAMLDEFVESMIGPLLREDRRGQLRTTLRSYLAFGGTQRATAEHLAIHRNTLAYRLRQIRQCLQVDPDDPDARLGLHLALLASELPPPRNGE